MFKVKLNGHETYFNLTNQEYYKLVDDRVFERMRKATDADMEDGEADIDILACILTIALHSYKIMGDDGKLRIPTWDELKDFIYSSDFKAFYENITEDPGAASMLTHGIYSDVMPIMF